jgi:putative transposase
MGRKPREKSQGNIFHVYQRGNNKEHLFKSNESKGMLIHTYRDFMMKFDYEILGYVIMDNHYHFLIKVNNDPLEDVMRFINITYSKYLNKTLNRSGHIYESRYKCKRVDSNEYLLWLIRYIHRNPIRAELVQNINDYFWSSHYYYKNAKTGFVNIDFILGIISNKKASAQLEYMKYVTAEGDEDFNEGLKIESVHFEKDFANQDVIIRANCLMNKRENLDNIGDRVFQDSKVKDIILSGGRQRHLTQLRINFIREAISLRYTIKEIADYLNCAESTVSAMLSRYKEIY